MSKHTKQNCFQIVGYLDWWEDNHKPPQARARAAVGVEGHGSVGTEQGDPGVVRIVRSREMEDKEVNRSDNGSGGDEMEKGGKGFGVLPPNPHSLPNYFLNPTLNSHICQYSPSTYAYSNQTTYIPYYSSYVPNLCKNSNSITYQVKSKICRNDKWIFESPSRGVVVEHHS